MTIEHLNQDDADRISELLVGRRIVSAELGSFAAPDDNKHRSLFGPDHSEGLLILDDGTELYLEGNDGGCACSAGCYPLMHVAKVDNVITSARVYASPTGDDYWDDEINGEGVYQIFVFADNEEINVASFEGSDGNGYYGTGFSITVRRP